jgi:hypothetical protein
MTPQEAIEKVKKEFKLVNDKLFDDDYNEFNRLFHQWLDEEMDLRVEKRT